MLKIGITGQNGFIGYHLFQTIKYNTKFELVPFEKAFFSIDQELDKFVLSCDVIVHLAAMNRHLDPNVIYSTNIELTQKLIGSLERTKATPHIIMSSSTQEENDNLYGKSKKEGRQLLENWAIKTNSIFNGLLIPNVFGPFGKPEYNSVVATFCHKIANNEIPQINVDANLSLIYVGDLVKEILKIIEFKNFDPKIKIEHTHQIQVSEILNLLNFYNTSYYQSGEIPSFKSKFELDLFNTFRSYFKFSKLYPTLYKKNTDTRGTFVELIRLNIGGQVSFSTTKPGITRGNHFHLRKIERFAVIQGKALIQFRKIGDDTIFNFEIDGNNPGYVDMPIWYTHNIKNIGDQELITVFWINEFYNPEDPDTYFEEV